ncbi:MAG TPA: AAA family ATPase [Candidatus Choladousia intestinavium]|uniref:AAA family ATPase n=1 Tax=Candidatus Choladousia intestinavium TaxID=2840727 RepID=A0A9D1D8M4_9FIRM|nr:AAA family ATPase [Candidatus Choladousia intestinavium]
MEKIYLTELFIENVRHLKDITILLSEKEIKHLILTGRNGSGKTSVIESLSHYLGAVAASEQLKQTVDFLKYHEKALKELQAQGEKSSKIIEEERAFRHYKTEFEKLKSGVDLKFNQPVNKVRYSFEKGDFVLAYYKADRIFYAQVSDHIEKVELKDKYEITETPRELFVKYLVDLKVTEALARNGGKSEKADAIKEWFEKFQNLLRRIFDDDSLELIFDEDTFSFSIKEKNRDLFDFNTLSSGFAAVLDIILDLIVRMEKKTQRSFDFNIPGIVLIDEIETHLHIELQKSVLSLLTTIFPNVQFIMSTHSPFILNSLPNVVIYDLENKIIVKNENGLTNVPYEGIVEGYFESSEMSDLLKRNFERYKELVKKEKLTDDDFEEIAKLEIYLDEIPDYLALDLTTEYQQLKLEFENRGDI